MSSDIVGPKVYTKEDIAEFKCISAQNISTFPRTASDVIRGTGSSIVLYTGEYRGAQQVVDYGKEGDYLVTFKDGKKRIYTKEHYELLIGKSVDVVVEHKEPEKKQEIKEQEDGEDDTRNVSDAADKPRRGRGKAILRASDGENEGKLREGNSESDSGSESSSEGIGKGG